MLSRCLLAIGLVLSFSTAPFAWAQGPRSPEQVMADGINSLKMHDAWGPAASTPHTSLEIREIGHADGVYKFHLLTKGLPNNTTYSLVEVAGYTEESQGVDAKCSIGRLGNGDLRARLQHERDPR